MTPKKYLWFKILPPKKYHWPPCRFTVGVPSLGWKQTVLKMSQSPSSLNPVNFDRWTISVGPVGPKILCMSSLLHVFPPRKSRRFDFSYMGNQVSWAGARGRGVQSLNLHAKAAVEVQTFGLSMNILHLFYKIKYSCWTLINFKKLNWA